MSFDERLRRQQEQLSTGVARPRRANDKPPQTQVELSYDRKTALKKEYELKFAAIADATPEGILFKSFLENEELVAAMTRFKTAREKKNYGPLYYGFKGPLKFVLEKEVDYRIDHSGLDKIKTEEAYRAEIAKLALLDGNSVYGSHLCVRIDNKGIPLKRIMQRDEDPDQLSVKFRKKYKNIGNSTTGEVTIYVRWGDDLAEYLTIDDLLDSFARYFLTGDRYQLVNHPAPLDFDPYPSGY